MGCGIFLNVFHTQSRKKENAAAEAPASVLAVWFAFQAKRYVRAN